MQNQLAGLTGFLHQAAHDATPLHEIEAEVWRSVLHLGHAALQLLFSLLGSGDQGPTLDLPDGSSLERLDQTHPRRYVSVFGEFHLQRTAYGSREGQKIECVPLDNRLQLPDSDFSYLLQDWGQDLCTENAFGQVQRLFDRMLHQKLPVGSLEHGNRQMAQRVQQYRENRPMPQPEDEGELLVLSADGKGIVMRRSAEAPAAPAHRTKGEKASQKRMAIVGAAYSVDRYVRTPEQILEALFREGERSPEPRPQPRHKHVWASLEQVVEGQAVSGIEMVYPWLLNEVAERNGDWTREMVYLHDGQEALWEACRAHLPTRNATEVLDLLHVTPRLWRAAHLFHAEKSAAATAFVRLRLLRMLRGEAKGVVQGLRRMGTLHGLKGSKKKTLATLCGYLEKNQERMRYDEYLTKGYPIASGVIEGACRHLVKDRMERAGMHWTVEGAQAMLDVRSVHVNGDWEAYQAYRIERESKRLFPWRECFVGPDFTLAA